MNNSETAERIVNDYSKEELVAYICSLYLDIKELDDRITDYGWAETARQQERSGGWM